MMCIIPRDCCIGVHNLVALSIGIKLISIGYMRYVYIFLFNV